MLRIYLLQKYYWLTDQALEAVIHDRPLLRDFVGIDQPRKSAPDATTLPKFRRLLLAFDLTKAHFSELYGHLRGQGSQMRADANLHATVIATRSSTQNVSGESDPEMHHAKKGNQSHHGMTARFGVDVDSELVQSLLRTAANTHDVTQAGARLHDEEADALRGAGHFDAAKREEAQGPQWHIAMQPGKRKLLSDNAVDQLVEKVEKIKTGIQANIEHPFQVIKNLFRHMTTRYRGLPKRSCWRFMAEVCLGSGKQARCGSKHS